MSTSERESRRSLWILSDESVLSSKAQTHALGKLKDYKFESRIGVPGHFGEAWRAQRRMPDGKWKPCCVKRISKARFMTGGSRSRRYIRTFRTEVKVMRKINHENCVRFYEAMEDARYLYLSMELCTGGDFFEYLTKLSGKKTLSEKKAAEIFAQILRGVKHIHDQDLGHFDLKPENLVFLRRGQDAPIKIIDFGMSKPIPPHVYLHRFAGTLMYAAPEVIKGNYTKTADMWSLGVILFIMLYGYPPFHAPGYKLGRAANKLLRRIIERGFVPQERDGHGAWFPKGNLRVSPEAKNLIASLLTTDTNKRLTVDETLTHPWFVRARSLDIPLDPRVRQSLIEFRGVHKLGNLVLHALVSSITDAQERVLESAYEMLAKGSADGMVSINELRKYLGKLEIKTVEEVFSAVDLDNSGRISLHEVRVAYIQRRIQQKEERLWEAFTLLDKEGRMSLTVDAVAKAVSSVNDSGHTFSESEIKAAFQAADLDNDGVVDYDEFLFTMASARVPPRTGTLPRIIWDRERKGEQGKLKKKAKASGTTAAPAAAETTSAASPALTRSDALGTAAAAAALASLTVGEDSEGSEGDSAGAAEPKKSAQGGGEKKQGLSVEPPPQLTHSQSKKRIKAHVGVAKPNN